MVSEMPSSVGRSIADPVSAGWGFLIQSDVVGKTSRGAIGGLANRVIRKIPTPFSQLEIAASRKPRGVN